MIDDSLFLSKYELDVKYIKDGRWVFYKTIDTSFKPFNSKTIFEVFTNFLENESKSTDPNNKYLLVESKITYGDYDYVSEAEKVHYLGTLDITDYSSVYEIKPCNEVPIIENDFLEIYNTKIEDFA